ncbi:hypothetical protein TcWFU_009183 [Taenia crassiceps]|uniref:Uncharacterized protein n=1 Tax=Taenia crassiceps TaxID=6207 RepID=A0ABR4Q256_9CEST
MEGIFMTISPPVGRERKLTAHVRGGEMRSILYNLALHGSLAEALSDIGALTGVWNPTKAAFTPPSNPFPYQQPRVTFLLLGGFLNVLRRGSWSFQADKFTAEAFVFRPSYTIYSSLCVSLEIVRSVLRPQVRHVKSSAVMGFTSSLGNRVSVASEAQSPMLSILPDMTDLVLTPPFVISQFPLPLPNVDGGPIAWISEWYLCIWALLKDISRSC